MRYMILCYSAENAVCAMSQEADAAMMKQLAEAKADAARSVRFKFSGRLMPTTAATTVREGKDITVLDGPFAETKEQLLGFYLLEADSLDDAIQAAKRLAEPRMNAGLTGALEVRPLFYFDHEVDQEPTSAMS